MNESEYQLATAVSNLRGASHLLGEVSETHLPLSVTLKLRKIRIDLIDMASNVDASVPLVGVEDDEGDIDSRICGAIGCSKKARRNGNLCDSCLVDC